jgi:hypothetical protein
VCWICSTAVTSPRIPLGPGRSFVHEMLELARQTPIGAVLACEQTIAQRLRRLLTSDGGADLSGFSVTDLAYLAHEGELSTTPRETALRASL